MPTSQSNIADQDDGQDEPAEAPNEASVNRSRQQGLGFGARELAMQHDPDASGHPEEHPVSPSGE